MSIHEKLCVKFVIYKDHTTTHGQQNIKFCKMVLRSFEYYSPNDTASHARRLESSAKSLLEPQIKKPSLLISRNYLSPQYTTQEFHLPHQQFVCYLDERSCTLHAYYLNLAFFPHISPRSLLTNNHRNDAAAV